MVKKEYQGALAGNKKTAKAIAKNAPISVKYSTEICNKIKGQPVEKIIAWLGRIEKMEEHLPLNKYYKKIGHRKGTAKNGTKTGRYPIKAVKKISEVIESAKTNADYLGLDTEKLIIVSAFASKGLSRQSMQPKGRIGGKSRQKKSTNIEVVLMEVNV